MRFPLLPLAALALVTTSLASLAATAPDEGMWTFDHPPRGILAERYGFEPTDEWLRELSLSSVRVNDGGSGSFISPDGLVLTNHHVGFEAISELSSENNDLIANGFYAATRAEELPCKDLELNVLQAIEDVTARVLGAVQEGASEADARQQREAEIAAIEKEAGDATGLRCDVIELYRGGQYALYQFKKYTEIKLVFAPEVKAAFFGGDPDNFTFPRYCLDMCIFRAYEDGAPAKTPHYLHWNPKGPEEGGLVFVSGNPGSTGRLNTLAQLETLRDTFYPLYLRGLHFRHDALNEYAARGDEEARRAHGQLFGIENSIKALSGYYDSLAEGRSMELKAAAEKELRQRVAANPGLAAEVGSAWDDIAGAQAAAREIAVREYCTRIRGSRLFTIARDIVRLVEEREKPNADRLPRYRESALDSLELELYSDAPIYPDLEEVSISTAIAFMQQELGDSDPLVRAAVGEVGAKEASATGATTSELLDPAKRRALVEGGPEAVLASTDPILRLAARMDPISRELEQAMKDRVRSIEARAGEKIAHARFSIYGSSVYPDATFTPRLAFGVVRGFETGGYNMPWKTTFHGLYERSADFDDKDPYTLSAKFAAAEHELDLDTPFNFVCTADIIGGNSGSPVVDRDGRFVGLVFDGNIQMLGNRFVYDDTVSRTVAVHSAGILEALRTVYGADALVAEILGQH